MPVGISSHALSYCNSSLLAARVIAYWRQSYITLY